MIRGRSNTRWWWSFGRHIGSVLCLCVSMHAQEVEADNGEERIVEIGQSVAYRAFPRNYIPGMTAREKQEEANANRYPMRATDESGFISFSRRDSLDIGIADLDHAVLELPWLRSLNPGEVHTLSIVPSRLSEKSVDVLRHMQVARLHLGFRFPEDLQRVSSVSRRLEECVLFEVPNGLFEFRKDMPRKEWVGDEQRNMVAAIKEVIKASTLRSVTVWVFGPLDEVAFVVAERKQLEVLDLRGNGKGMSDKGLRAVATLPKLRDLVVEIEPTVVSGDGLEVLFGMRSLERLELRGADRRLAVRVDQLKPRLPTTEVVVVTGEK